jgi:tRNA 2-thiouridine synthesizing protein A
MDIDVDVTVDVSGLRCPEPLMVVRNKIMDMESGRVLKVTATDLTTTWDIPNYCKYLKHELLRQEEHDKIYSFWIRKGNGR